MSNLQIEKIASDRYRLRFKSHIITLDAGAMLDVMEYTLRYARTLEQERDIAEYTRLMEAGPFPEHEQALHLLIDRAAARGMYFDYDRVLSVYWLVRKQSDEPRTIEEALSETPAEFAAGFSEERQIHQDETPPTSGPRTIDGERILDW